MTHRCIILIFWYLGRFFLGIGVGAEYPCGSVAASEQSEEEGIAKNAQNRWFALATNSMIDFGFVVSSFVPLVLFWMYVKSDQMVPLDMTYLTITLVSVRTTFVLSGVFHSVLVSFLLLLSSSGDGGWKNRPDSRRIPCPASIKLRFRTGSLSSATGSNFLRFASPGGSTTSSPTPSVSIRLLLSTSQSYAFERSYVDMMIDEMILQHHSR